MFIGMVTGRVQILRQVAALEGQCVLLVRGPQGQLLALNRVGAKIGDRVLVGEGNPAGFFDFPGGPQILAVVAPIQDGEAER